MPVKTGNDKEGNEAQKEIGIIPWYKSLSQTFCLLGALCIICIFIYLQTRQKIGVSETLLLMLISVILSAGISAYLTRYVSYDQALKRIEGEAKKALRRIDSIYASAERLNDNIGRIITFVELKFGKKGEKELLMEFFSGIQSQVLDLIGNIQYSIQDWGDIVPKEVAGRRDLEKKKLELYEKRQMEIMKLVKQYKEESEKDGKVEIKKLRKAFDERLIELNNKFITEKAKMSIGTMTFSGLSSMTASLPDKLDSKSLQHYYPNALYPDSNYLLKYKQTIESKENKEEHVKK